MIRRQLWVIESFEAIKPQDKPAYTRWLPEGNECFHYKATAMDRLVQLAGNYPNSEFRIMKYLPIE